MLPGRSCKPGKDESRERALAAVAGNLAGLLAGDFSDISFTDIYSLNYSARLSERLNINSGFSYSNTENKEYGSNSESLSVSMGTSCRLIPGRLNSVLYNSQSMRKNDHPLICGDRREGDNNYDAYGLTVRGLYNF